MKLSPRYVGARSKLHHTTLTLRDSMLYAASVGDDNPRYLDDLRPEGVIAPPMMATQVTWPLAERLPDFWAGGEFPVEVMDRQVHFTEGVVWHRVMRPGDDLTVQGEVAAIVPHRAGTVMTVRYRVTDADDQPVFDEFSGVLLRRVRCDGEGRGAESLPVVPERQSEDAVAWEQTLPIDALAPYVFDGCANLPFAIHTSPQFAKRVGLPGIIYQAGATLSIAVRELVNREAAGDPARLKSVTCSFTGMVFPETDIIVRLLERAPGDAVDGLFFEVLNAEGKRAIRGGYAVVAH